ncbi:MAG: hypothetical protein JO333_19180, partial [Verrucomicrobia bacterium]|nr:hypothetical protein [Verrucomicrobiota bacterium]
VETEGKALFELTKEKGMEGIIAKRKDSLYRPGKRTSDWLKIKARLQQEFVVGGFTESMKAIRSSANLSMRTSFGSPSGVAPCALKSKAAKRNRGNLLPVSSRSEHRSPGPIRKRNGWVRLPPIPC